MNYLARISQSAGNLRDKIKDGIEEKIFMHQLIHQDFKNSEAYVSSDRIGALTLSVGSGSAAILGFGATGYNPLKSNPLISLFFVLTMGLPIAYISTYMWIRDNDG